MAEVVTERMEPNMRSSPAATKGCAGVSSSRFCSSSVGAEVIRR